MRSTPSAELHAPQALPSWRHWNVPPASEELNAKLAESAATVPDGPDTMEVSGGVVSLGGGTTSLRFLGSGLRGLVFDRTSSASGEPSASVSVWRGFVCDRRTS